MRVKFKKKATSAEKVDLITFVLLFLRRCQYVSLKTPYCESNSCVWLLVWKGFKRSDYNIVKVVDQIGRKGKNHTDAHDGSSGLRKTNCVDVGREGDWLAMC